MAATQVVTRQLKDLSVTTAKLAAASVTFAKVANDAIGIDQILKSPDAFLTLNLSGLEGFGPTGKEVRVKPRASGGLGIAADASGMYTTAVSTITSPNGTMLFNATPVANSPTTYTGDFVSLPGWSTDRTIGQNMWMDTTNPSVKVLLPNVTRMKLGGTISVASSSSTAIANTTTETNFSNSTATINAGDMGQEAVYRITAWGTYGTTATPTVQFRVKNGANIVQGGNLTMKTGATGQIWHVDATMVIKATGSSGTIESRIASGADNGIINQRQGTQTINTGSSQTFNLSVQWSAANASNTITCLGYVFEQVG